MFGGWVCIRSFVYVERRRGMVGFLRKDNGG